MDFAFADIDGIHCVALEGRNCSVEAVKYLQLTGRKNIVYKSAQRRQCYTVTL